MKKEIKNLSASIHARLSNQARESGRPFQELLHYYANERFLDRVSRSKFCRNLILKGGLVFLGWGISLRRPTRDIDFQAIMNNSNEEVKKVIEEICSIQISEDGMFFDTAALSAETIMADAVYEGVRIRFPAYLGKSNVVLQVDFSFANVITPKEVIIEYPTLLDMPSFELRGYNQETAIAEKFQAMIFLAGFNSRMKDFYDIHLLARECKFDGSVLVQALVATFENRETEVPQELPMPGNSLPWFGYFRCNSSCTIALRRKSAGCLSNPCQSQVSFTGAAGPFTLHRTQGYGPWVHANALCPSTHLCFEDFLWNARFQGRGRPLSLSRLLQAQPPSPARPAIFMICSTIGQLAVSFVSRPSSFAWLYSFNRTPYSAIRTSRSWAVL
jgi:predicted nucleotidyltransferase component of viral defense system